MGDALNHFEERLSSIEVSGKKRNECHSHRHHSRKEIGDDRSKRGHKPRDNEGPC